MTARAEPPSREGPSRPEAWRWVACFMLVAAASVHALSVGVRAFAAGFAVYGEAWLVGRWVNRVFLHIAARDESPLERAGRAAIEIVMGMALLSFALLLGNAAGLPVRVVLLVLAPVALLEGRSLGQSRARMSGPSADPREAMALAALLFACVVITSTAIVVGGSHIHMRDVQHPTYEMSIAQAVDLDTGTDRPDLSYAGKRLRYHLFGPQWLAVFDRAAAIDPLVIANRLVPAWQLTIGLVLIAFLGARATGSPSAGILAAAAFAFVHPLVWPAGERLDFALQYPNFSHLAHHASAGVAICGSLSFVAMVLHALRRGVRAVDVVAASVLAAFTFYSKAPFIAAPLVVFGAWAVSRVRYGEWKPALLVFCCVISVVPFALSLGGAHPQNFWAAVPHARFLGFWLRRLGEDWLLTSWLLAIATGVPGTFGIAALGVIAGWASVKRLPGADSGLAMVLFACAAAGIAGASVISDIAEGNHRQFALAFLWVGYLGVVIWWKARRTSIAATRVAVGGCAMVAAGTFAAQVLRFDAPASGSIDRDLHAVLTAMRSLPRDGTVLRGRHYEDPDWRRRTQASEWRAGTGFVASAVSGHQFVIEHHQFKGVLMESDYLRRTEDVFRFYSHCSDVEPDPWNVPAGPPRPVAVEEWVRETKTVRSLTLKGEPSLLTGRPAVERRLAELLPGMLATRPPLSNRAEVCRSILDAYGVRYVLFEQNETPIAAMGAADGLSLVLHRNSVRLYRVSTR